MKKLLFVRIPKNASVSVICLFEDKTVKCLQSTLGRETVRFAWTNTFFNYSIPRSLTSLTKNTRKTAEIVEEQEFWKDYYSFCFVRNPYERAISSWKFGSWKDNWECSFEDYLLKLKENKEKLKIPFSEDGLMHHSSMQYPYIYDQDLNLKVDFVGKIETFKQDLRKVLTNNGLAELGWLPHRNKTKHRSYEEYYDTTTRDLVEEVYEKDIELLNYNF